VLFAVAVAILPLKMRAAENGRDSIFDLEMRHERISFYLDDFHRQGMETSVKK